MSTLPEFVGTIHIFLGPYRGNPIALYLRQDGESCHISPTIYPWNRFVGVGETVNKAAADFDAKWKEGDLAPEMYSGPHWEGGIKPEKPKPPPKPAAPPKAAATESAQAEGASSPPPKTEASPTAAVPPSTPVATTPPVQATDVKPASTAPAEAGGTPSTSPTPSPSSTEPSQ